MNVDKAIAVTRILPGRFRARLFLTPGADDYRQQDQRFEDCFAAVNLEGEFGDRP